MSNSEIRGRRHGEGEIKTIEEVADIVFSIIPQEELVKYEVKLGNNTLTLKDRFIIHFMNMGVKPRLILNRYFLEKSTIRIILEGKFSIEDKEPNFKPFYIFFGW